MIKIAPSVLALDFTKIHEQMTEINKYADWIHFDVMDGHFVPNISYGPIILDNIKKVSPLFMDVHLMVEKPKQFADWFIASGADLITFHIEAVADIDEAKALIQHIKAQDVQVGISVKPNTDVQAIEALLNELDLVLVMSVEPGFGGQVFMEDMLKKVEQLKALRTQHDYTYVIEIDGGINDVTAKKAVEAGVDVLVAGSYVFGDDIKGKIDSLK